MIVEKQMEIRLARETEVLGENVPQRHFCQSQNPTWPYPGLNPGRRGGKPATNRLIYGAAISILFLHPFSNRLRLVPSIGNKTKQQVRDRTCNAYFPSDVSVI
jgi:hypothetical protein